MNKLTQEQMNRFSRPKVPRTSSPQKKRGILRKIVENSERVPQGLSILHEYIFYYGIQYQEKCRKKDVSDKSRLIERDFRMIIDDPTYKLSMNQMDDIMELCPRSFDNEIKYTEFFLLIKKLGKPNSLFSVANLLKFEKDGLTQNDYQMITADDYFKVKSHYDLRNFNLHTFKMSRGRKGIEGIDNFNNKICLQNFLRKFSQECIEKIREMYYQKKIVKDKYFYKGFGISEFESSQFIFP